MAKRYPPEVGETVWTLLCEGVGTRAIQERLASGADLPIAPVDMPRRTLNDLIARLKRDRGIPEAVVNPGQEVRIADAIVRQTLAAVARTEAQLTDTSKLRPLTSAELSALERCARIAQAIKRGIEDPDTSANKPSSKGESSSAPVPGSFLAELDAAEPVESPEDRFPTTDAQARVTSDAR